MTYHSYAISTKKKTDIVYRHCMKYNFGGCRVGLEDRETDLKRRERIIKKGTYENMLSI